MTSNAKAKEKDNDPNTFKMEVPKHIPWQEYLKKWKEKHLPDEEKNNGNS
jgi:hypothetical protein